MGTKTARGRPISRPESAGEQALARLKTKIQQIAVQIRASQGLTSMFKLVQIPSSGKTMVPEGDIRYGMWCPRSWEAICAAIHLLKRMNAQFRGWYVGEEAGSRVDATEGNRGQCLCRR